MYKHTHTRTHTIPYPEKERQSVPTSLSTLRLIFIPFISVKYLYALFIILAIIRLLSWVSLLKQPSRWLSHPAMLH